MECRVQELGANPHRCTRLVWKHQTEKKEQGSGGTFGTMIEKHCWLMKEQTGRSMEQSRAPRSRPHECARLTCDQGAKAAQWSEDCLVSERCWNNWMSTRRAHVLDTDLTRLEKPGSGCSTDLSVKCETIKLLEISWRKPSLGVTMAF